MNIFQVVGFSISCILVIISTLTMSGILADEQVIQGNLFVALLFAVFIGILPYFLMKIKRHRVVFIYGVCICFLGLVIIYPDNQVIGFPGFHVVGNIVPSMLAIAGIIISICAFKK